MNLKFIYKILSKIEWEDVKDKSEFKGTKKDLEDGYIHFSEGEQVEGTLKKFYKNQKELVLLKVKTINLDHLIWEQTSDGNMFPHLYSTLELSNIMDEFKIDLDEDGNHKLPDNF